MKNLLAPLLLLLIIITTSCTKESDRLKENAKLDALITNYSKCDQFLNTKEPAELIRVVDGDTIIVLYKGKKERVRLLCVDTAESVHPKKDRNTDKGRATSKAVKEKLKLVKKVLLEFEDKRRDKYKRLLAYVWIGDEMLNLWLIKNGHSVYVTKWGKSVNYHGRFKRSKEY